MGGSASTLDLTHIRLTEDECKLAAQELFQPRVFRAYADDANKLVSVDDLKEWFKWATDCYLTHDGGRDLGMDNHARVSRVNEALKERGLRTWFNDGRMEGNVKKKIISGIENTNCMVVFVTKRYVDRVNSANLSDNCHVEFNYGSRRKTGRKMIPVVMEDRMQNSADWHGEMGMVLGGNLVVDLTTDDCFEERMDELHRHILGVTGTTVQKVLDNPMWGEFIAQKSHSGAADNSCVELLEWIGDHTKIVPQFANTYARQLVDIGVDSVAKLRKKLLCNADFLHSLDFDEDDAEELVMAVLGQMGASSAVKEFQDLYEAYISAHTLGNAGKELIEEASRSTDHERAMVAKMLLALAYDVGGGTFTANKVKSRAYAAEVLPWMHKHALPPADEVIALSDEDPKPFALSTMVTAVLAWMLRDGVGCEKDEAKAVLFMKAAVPHGISMAQFLLGYAIKAGDGTPMNKEQGVHFYRLAAAQGYPMAIVNLSISYYNGEGVQKDFVEACHLFKIVADQGHSRGLYELGIMYFNGEGVAKDFNEAARLFQQSHDKGSTDSTYMLGVCYAYGNGVNKDVDKAKELLRRAVTLGHDLAQATLSKLL